MSKKTRIIIGTTTILIMVVVSFYCHVFKITPIERRSEFYWNMAIGLFTFFGALVASGGVIFAASTLKENSNIAKKQATIAIINSFNEDKKLQEIKNFIFTYSHTDLNQIFCTTGNMNSSLGQEAAKDDILYVLNRYEFIALGIREGAFDEELYKYLQCSNILKLWEKARSLVTMIRQEYNKETLFQELEWLAEKWSKDPVKKIA